MRDFPMHPMLEVVLGALIVTTAEAIWEEICSIGVDLPMPKADRKVEQLSGAVEQVPSTMLGTPSSTARLLADFETVLEAGFSANGESPLIQPVVLRGVLSQTMDCGVPDL